MAEAVIVPENELLTAPDLVRLPGRFGVELAGLDLRQKQDPRIGALHPTFGANAGCC